MGQINLAKGYARPILESVKLPADVQEKLIVTDQYDAAQPIEDTASCDKAAAKLGETWQEDVLTKIK